MRSCREIINRRKELWEESHDIERDTEFVQAAVRYIVDPNNSMVREEISRYPEYLIEISFVIVDKDKNTVPFFLNEVQESFLVDINKAKDEYRVGKRLHLKFLVLKGRQQGFTSFITGYQLANGIISKNFSGFTLADSGDNTNTIFEDKAKYIYNQLPDALKPTEKYNNRREFHFEKLNSRWRVNTAGNKEVGRSKTINFFHGSEAAFWDGMRSIVAGLGQALTKDSIQILETTANGFNEYKDLWDEDNNWENKFYAWWKTKEYRFSFVSSDDQKLFIARTQNHKSEPTEELRKVFEKINHLRNVEKLDWEQLHWYFNKWKDLKEETNQEYPCYPEEAFLATGKNVFDKEKVTSRIAVLRKKYELQEPIRGNFVWDMHGEQIWDNSIKFNPDPSGFITIYKEPKAKVPYVIGGDTSEGGIDFSAGQVLDNLTGEQVAVWHGHIDTDLYAKNIYCLGKHYNNALAAIEMNFDLHPIKELTRLNYYWQYRRENIDSSTNQTQNKYGFRTTSTTRPVIISELMAIVRDEIELINDIPTLQEMLTFVRNENGKPEAIVGKHDDLIMSLAIAHKAREQQVMNIVGAAPWAAIPEGKENRDFDADDDDRDGSSAETFW
ncbi:hypothetical protein J2W97_002265 [Paenibacillus jamilae]|nr:hypothetical protein [Paenibacillus jamilae]